MNGFITYTDWREMNLILTQCFHTFFLWECFLIKNSELWIFWELNIIKVYFSFECDRNYGIFDLLHFMYANFLKLHYYSKIAHHTILSVCIVQKRNVFLFFWLMSMCVISNTIWKCFNSESWWFFSNSIESLINFSNNCFYKVKYVLRSF